MFCVGRTTAPYLLQKDAGKVLFILIADGFSQVARPHGPAAQQFFGELDAPVLYVYLLACHRFEVDGKVTAAHIDLGGYVFRFQLFCQVCFHISCRTQNAYRYTGKIVLSLCPGIQLWPQLLQPDCGLPLLREEGRCAVGQPNALSSSCEIRSSRRSSCRRVSGERASAPHRLQNNPSSNSQRRPRHCRVYASSEASAPPPGSGEGDGRSGFPPGCPAGCRRGGKSRCSPSLPCAAWKYSRAHPRRRALCTYSKPSWKLRTTYCRRG